MRGLIVFLLLVVVAGGVAVYVLGSGHLGRHEGPGRITGAAVPEDAVERRGRAVAEAEARLGEPGAKQILFGDLHVHTTFSFDAFAASLPLAGGEGAHPPADACDFARYCSALDFWSINDHAEALTPRHWRETVESVRQCNAVAGDPADPDVVAFLGWEWSQVGLTPETHFGHRNVVLLHTEEGRIPARPISSRALAGGGVGLPGVGARAVLALAGGERFDDLARYLAERADLRACEENVPVRELPGDCQEVAETPRELFGKLDEWGHEALVIPHGTAWGLYTPPAYTFDKALDPGHHDPARERLAEVYSGHGNSEEYARFRAVRYEDGEVVCPEESDDYLPGCRRAGQIVRARCEEAGLPESECEERARAARLHYARAGLGGRLTVPGTVPEDWLDAGHCWDCFQPAFRYRPGGSVQYLMALRRFDGEGEPRRLRYGFIASSDNHGARPGTGYKEIHREGMTDTVRTRGVGREAGPLVRALAGGPGEPGPRSEPLDLASREQPLLRLFDFERQASYFMTGGLVAVHTRSRDRGAIWDALVRKEVYGTSGPRILLWFDLVNGPGGGTAGSVHPMGSTVRMGSTPRFSVRAAGSFEQRAGCPKVATSALSPERLERLCRGECYNPGDQRRRITRIEVVRIRPQARAGEPVSELIDDPWRVLPCPAAGAGCAVTFEDPGYTATGRDALYYVRAIEEPSPAIAADPLGCERDESGDCARVHLCGRDPARGDDCRSETEQRAWSSPIFVDFPRS